MQYVKAGTVKLIDESYGILGCINENDGGGYIHALLNSYHPGYSQINQANYRIHLAKSIRIGALPKILKEYYGTDSLYVKEADTKKGFLRRPGEYVSEQKRKDNESKLLFSLSVSHGTSLPDFMLPYYADFLKVPYVLHDANLNVIDYKELPEGREYIEPCHIVKVTDSEYHLLVKLILSQQDDRVGTIRYKILDKDISREFP